MTTLIANSSQKFYNNTDQSQLAPHDNGAAYAIYLDPKLACQHSLLATHEPNGNGASRDTGQEFYLLSELTPSSSDQESNSRHLQPSDQGSVSPSTTQSVQMAAHFTSTSADQAGCVKSQLKFVSANGCGSHKSQFDLQTDV